MKTALACLLVVVGISVFSLVSIAQTDDPEHPEVFAKRFIEAIGSKSPEHRKALVHPKSLACINAQTEPFYNEIFSRQLKYKIPANCKSVVTPIPANYPSMFKGQFDYPLLPTHQIQIDFDTGPHSGTTIVLFVVYDAKRWYEVLPCPRPEIITRMQAAKEAAVKQEQRAQLLAAQLSEPLRTELIELAKKGRRVEAIKKYSSTSGVDLAIANRVVELLAPDEH
jgi:hypothetical protein